MRQNCRCAPGIREHQPERGPVPSTSMSGNARRSRSFRRCQNRSASVSGYGPAARSSSHSRASSDRSRSRSRNRARRVSSCILPRIAQTAASVAGVFPKGGVPCARHFRFVAGAIIPIGWDGCGRFAPYAFPQTPSLVESFPSMPRKLPRETIPTALPASTMGR